MIGGVTCFGGKMGGIRYEYNYSAVGPKLTNMDFKEW